VRNALQALGITNYTLYRISYNFAFVRLLAIYLTTILGMNVSLMQTWRIVHDLGIVSRRPKLALEHAEESVTKIQKKSMKSPDETHTFEKGKVEIAKVG
jgi:hypothetical protein